MVLVKSNTVIAIRKVRISIFFIITSPVENTGFQVVFTGTCPEQNANECSDFMPRMPIFRGTAQGSLREQQRQRMDVVRQAGCSNMPPPLVQQCRK
jgi:hypothetical protein